MDEGVGGWKGYPSLLAKISTPPPMELKYTPIKRKLRPPSQIFDLVHL